MSSSLSRVRARRTQIANRLAAMSKEATDLRAEDSDLAVTERTLARLEGDTQPNLDLVGDHKVPLANRFAGERPSIKQMIVRTLEKAPETWAPDAQWLWEAIRRDFSVEINKNSFYPQISSLVDQDKTVVRDGKKIALVERLSRRELREITGREAAE